MITRRLGTGAVAVAAIAVLAGCGGSSSPSTPASNAPAASGSASNSTAAGTNGEQTKPAAQILQDAKTALFNASSVHVTGTIASGSGSGSGAIDFRFVGNDAAGMQQISGMRVDVVKAGGKLYLKAPAGFWARTAGSKAAPKLADKWIVVPAGQAGGAGNLTLQQLAASLNADDSPLVPQVSTGEVGGRPAVLVRQQDGATLAVANTGDPVPLEITPPAGKQGKLTFTDYGKVKPIAAPSGAITPQQAAQSPKTGSA